MSLAEVLRKNFPYISSQEADSLHRVFTEYDVNPSWLFGNYSLEERQIAQGDILKGLNAGFWDFDASTNKPKFRKKENIFGIVLTTTCDNERNDYLSFVPLFESDQYFSKIKDKDGSLKDSIDSIKKNTVTTLLFLPATNNIPSLIGDFSLCISMTRNFLDNLRKQGKIQKAQTLTMQGYYFFLAKLTLHLMRPETLEVGRLAQ